MSQGRIVYFLPDVSAGVYRIVYNLLKYRPVGDYSYRVVLMHNKRDVDRNRITEPFTNAETVRFEYEGMDNVYTVYKKMALLLGPNDIIVGNDGYEIRMVVALRLKNPVVYIIHGDFKYYYGICRLNQDIIDTFIAYSSKIFFQLQNDLSATNREKVRLIYYPSGAVDDRLNIQKSTVFKILFAGTLNDRKGAHLLYNIYCKLFELLNGNFIMEIIGAGGLSGKLQQQFKDVANVALSGFRSNDYVMAKLAESHVFLFPSFLEGLPNVLVEAISQGAVPVSSDLQSGVRDVIEDGKNGILVETGDTQAFALSIAGLYNDREKLTEMQGYGLNSLRRFEPYRQARLYHETIAELVTAQKSTVDFPTYPMGRWLNKPWIPNFLVRTIRRTVNHPKL